MTDQEYFALRKRRPLHDAVINVTDQCNLRCPYCFTEHNNNVMTMDTMKASINFILENLKWSGMEKNAISIVFFGGEPMLRFEDIIKPTILWTEETGLRDQYNICFSMTSNGTLFNEESLKFLHKHQCDLLLSIDGDKFTQDDQRPAANGASSFDMINTQLILKYYPMVTFRSTLEPRNVDKILENYLFARNSNFMHWYIAPNVWAKWTPEDIKTMFEQLSLVAWTIYCDIKNGTTPLKWTEFFTVLQSLFMGVDEEYRKINFNHCGIGTNTVGIATNGDLYGCQEHNTYHNHDDIFYIGNVFTGFDVEKHKRLLTNYTEAAHPVCVDDPDRCKGCGFYDDCASHFCPSQNMMNGGAIYNHLITCLWKQFLEELVLIWLQQVIEDGDPKVIHYLEEQLIDHPVDNLSERKRG